ncbi:uncharacterized protein ASCRUDRAFT_70906 [Ascoidea rubescens DSM 1968]|uniref:UspA domain-containing protein n=1 Tax=Ascoidea rubescens DSM 1968 TaxID=1344418 RepID=A0A1D2VFZ0_9ASCO|nr:hypothetical protein ASCRUDRAFT_70906 [Ascoidea rubescens DSM 1968]ODV60387.1 hypothetical protein ASCRUDRAFT_70906 [Ascoidea rubescens DSM 1968]
MLAPHHTPSVSSSRPKPKLTSTESSFSRYSDLLLSSKENKQLLKFYEKDKLPAYETVALNVAKGLCSKDASDSSPPVSLLSSLLLLSNYYPRISFDTVNISYSPLPQYDFYFHYDDTKDREQAKAKGLIYESDSTVVSNFSSTKRVLSPDQRRMFRDIRRSFLSPSNVDEDGLPISENQLNLLDHLEKTYVYTKTHKDFQKIYANNDHENRNGSNKVSVLPGRVLIVYISGRRHTWVALDWVLNKLLEDGDTLIILSTIPEQLLNDIKVKKKPSKLNNHSTCDSRGRGRYSSPSASASASATATATSRSRSRYISPPIRQNNHRSKTPAEPLIRSVLSSTDLPAVALTQQEKEDQQKIYYDHTYPIKKVADKIMDYALKLINPNLVVKILLEFAIGDTKTIIAKALELYTPSFLVVSIKPKVNIESKKKWATSRLSDRLVKNYHCPIIIVPALKMDRFELNLFKSLNKKYSSFSSSSSSKNQNAQTAPNSQTAPNAPNTQDGQPKKSKKPTLTQEEIQDPKNVVIPKHINEGIAKSAPAIVLSSENKNINNISFQLLSPSGETKNILESLSSDESELSGSEADNKDDNLSEPDSDSDSEFENNQTETDSTFDNTISSAEDSEEDHPFISSKLKETDSDDLITKRIESRVDLYEVRLKRKLKKINLAQTDDKGEKLINEDYFVQKLETISDCCLYLSKDLKRLIKKLPPSSEGAKLVRSITGDVTGATRTFKPMIIEPKPVPASLLVPKKASAIQFDLTAKPSLEKASNILRPTLGERSKSVDYYTKGSTSQKTDRARSEKTSNEIENRRDRFFRSVSPTHIETNTTSTTGSTVAPGVSPTISSTVVPSVVPESDSETTTDEDRKGGRRKSFLLKFFRKRK